MIAFAGLTLATYAQDSTDQSQFPTILQQPVDQCLPVGSAATFTVQATNVDSYQWYLNGNPLDGQTNSSLTIPVLTTSDVGYYFASVVKGSEAVPTRSANLNVYVVSGAPTISASLGLRVKSLSANMALDLGGGGMITVFGAPVVSSGGSGTGCPGKYSGYVNFTKPPSQGGGWSMDTTTTVHTATDNNQTNTKVQYLGSYGDSNCGQATVRVPDPGMSPTYRFTIYFPSGTTVPTNSYGIILSGFNP